MSHTTQALSRSRFVAGCLFWISGIQYFVIEFLAQRAWGPVPYTLRFNTISDLGATICGTIPFMGTFACSPLHPLMNLSFILSGALTIAGLLLLRPLFPKHWTVVLASWLIILGSIGSIGVGIFPENEHPVPHLISALMLFMLANFGLIILGTALHRLSWRPKFAWFTLILGIIGLVAFLLLPLAITPLMGIGVLERFVAYPITVWVILSGMHLLAHPPAHLAR
jgi:hypothetical membrane protein